MFEFIDPYKFVGALGLAFITVALIVKEKNIQDRFYLIGSICLEFYSVYIQDTVFTVLQAIYTVFVLYRIAARNSWLGLKPEMLEANGKKKKK